MTLRGIRHERNVSFGRVVSATNRYVKCLLGSTLPLRKIFQKIAISFYGEGPHSRKTDRIIIDIYSLIYYTKWPTDGDYRNKRSFQKKKANPSFRCVYMKHTGGGASRKLSETRSRVPKRPVCVLYAHRVRTTRTPVPPGPVFIVQ